jgi:hypothetical protein
MVAAGRTIMRRLRLSLGVLGVLAVCASVLWIPNGVRGDSTKTVAVTKAPSYTQMNDPKVLIDFMDKRVTDLEQKVATLQKQLAAAQQQAATHTHSYQAPHCTEFTSLVNLQDAVSHPNNHPGMGICFIRAPSGGFPPAQTSAPGK